MTAALLGTVGTATSGTATSGTATSGTAPTSGPAAGSAAGRASGSATGSGDGTPGESTFAGLLSVLYGTAAANGVIQVTTRKGKP